MAMTAHLHFSGRCREAFEQYARLVGGEARFFAYGDTPMASDVPAEWSAKIAHATLTFDGGELAGSDVRPEHYHRPQGFSVLVDVAGVEEARRIFAALADGGSVAMPLQETFWSPAFGVLTDRFGVPWEINAKAAT